MGLLRDAAYLTGGLVALPWLLYKVATDRHYRDRLGERFGGGPEPKAGRVLWIHCASVGEVNLARPLVKGLKAAHPDLGFHVSAMTPAGREHAPAAFPEATVSYFPLDFSGAARRALRRLKPCGVVLVELEAWPNFLEACGRQGVPVAIVNGRMTERSFRRYRRFGCFFGGAFRGLAGVGAQNERYAGRLRELGAEPVVTGNLKFDADLAFDPAVEARRWRETLGLGEAPLLVAGSTHDPEERIVVEAYRKLLVPFPDLRLVLAPRHVDRADEVQKVVEAADLQCYKKSRSSPGGPGGGVILLDTVGELSRLYSAATVVFIGGTFCARGGQNMLEPAALGKPIVSGPSLSNFEDIAQTLTEAGGMKVLGDPAGLAPALEELLRDPAGARAAGERAAAAVEAGKGAIGATLRLIESSVLKGS